MSESYNCPPFLLPEAVIEIKILMDSLLLIFLEKRFLGEKNVDVILRIKVALHCCYDRLCYLAFDPNCSKHDVFVSWRLALRFAIYLAWPRVR